MNELWLKFLLWALGIAFLIARVEINIEGKNGWAKNLPTWRIKNEFTKFFIGDLPLTGYHFWMFLTIFIFFHFPFFLNLPWSFGVELRVIAIFILFIMAEDFLWFVLNPEYGIQKFNKKHAEWHKDWVGFLPVIYLKDIILIIIFLFLSLFLQ